MHRFFVSKDCIDQRQAVLTGQVARQLATVLRAVNGDAIALLDNTGREYMVTLSKVGKSEVVCTINEYTDEPNLPRTNIILYQAILKSDRFEQVLQKCTELGVSTIVPIITERCIRKMDGRNHGKRHARWLRILTEASEQSGRRRIPNLQYPVTFDEACDAARDGGLILWEEERDTSIKSGIQKSRVESTEADEIRVIVGPEGGLTKLEVEKATSKGMVSASLGNRVLRAETAAIVAVATIQYELGDLGG